MVSKKKRKNSLSIKKITKQNRRTLKRAHYITEHRCLLRCHHASREQSRISRTALHHCEAHGCSFERGLDSRRKNPCHFFVLVFSILLVSSFSFCLSRLYPLFFSASSFYLEIIPHLPLSPLPSSYLHFLFSGEFSQRDK